MRTYFPKQGEIEARWFIIDAEGKVLGRLSTTIARILSGKNKPIYTPFLDTGDHVIVINAEKIVLTGKKESDKIYRRHSQYPGGLKERSARSVRAEKPETMIEEAPQEPSRTEDAEEVEGLPRDESSASGAEAGADRSR